MRVGIGLKVQDVEDLNLGPGKAISDRPYRLLGMEGLVYGQQDLHRTSVLLAARLSSREIVGRSLDRHAVGQTGLAHHDDIF